MQTQCIFCGAPVILVHVHGHYQCPVCKTNALPCCDGDNCSNLLLATTADIVQQEAEEERSIPSKRNRSGSSID